MKRIENWIHSISTAGRSFWMQFCMKWVGFQATILHCKAILLGHWQSEQLRLIYNEPCLRHRINCSTYWPAVQHGTTARIAPKRNYKIIFTIYDFVHKHILVKHLVISILLTHFILHNSHITDIKEHLLWHTKYT